MSLFAVAARAFKTHLEKRDINGNSITMENGAIELGCSNKVLILLHTIFSPLLFSNATISSLCCLRIKKKSYRIPVCVPFHNEQRIDQIAFQLFAPSSLLLTLSISLVCLIAFSSLLIFNTASFLSFCPHVCSRTEQIQNEAHVLALISSCHKKAASPSLIFQQLLLTCSSDDQDSSASPRRLILQTD